MNGHRPFSRGGGNGSKCPIPAFRPLPPASRRVSVEGKPTLGDAAHRSVVDLRGLADRSGPAIELLQRVTGRSLAQPRNATNGREP